MRLIIDIPEELYEANNKGLEAEEIWDLRMAIKNGKTLEQEPILDKIRAEIVKKHLSIVEKNGFDSGRTYGYEEVLDIIDKYKEETEDT